MSMLSGVFPIVPTPFDADGAPNERDLERVVDYIVRAGADGIVFPGVASEFDTLKPEERTRLAATVARANRGRVPLVIGVSSTDGPSSLGFAAQAKELRAAAVMAMNPAAMKNNPEQIAHFYRDVAAACGTAVILQNAPPPLGSALTMEAVAALVETIPGIAYVKEETMPCGQRISKLLALKPRGLQGVFGGAGGRYITDELARGAAGTMPAAELTELHVRQFACHRAGDPAGVRHLFNRMLPLLNFQAVFRMAMTKEVLKRRGVISATFVRAAGPKLDPGDHRELDAMLAEISDILPARAA
jgi:4-hydroxy-tetrahydrodipicolinate synthase